MVARMSIFRKANPGWEMGFVIPRLLLAIALADAGLRALPVDPLTFRAWEALKRFRPPGAAFEPGRRYYNPQAYGDLAALGNLPELRQYRPETFTTDVLGFRNHGGPWRPPVAAIVVGDSFAVGAGLNDGEDLASGLGRSLGCRFYNAGGMDPDPDRILALARRLGMRGGLVIHEHHEDFELPAVPTDWRRRYQRVLASLDPSVSEAAGRVRGLVAVSPLKIVCERTLKDLEDDRALPNRHAGNVVKGTLPTGDSMLFLPSGIEKFNGRRPPLITYWEWMQRELRRGGLELFVVLVPSKYTVYRRFLADARPAPEGAGDYLDRVEARLRRAGIPVVNLTRPLSDGAGETLESREYLYWLDDLHWTPKGARVATLAVGDALRLDPSFYLSSPSAGGAETARRSASRWRASSASQAPESTPDSMAETSRVSSSAAVRRTASNP
jgi:SGNH hydrolase-like domain, acetyltransferase AlgX